ncbi:Winged helix-turn-helix transcription repressor DNA-binding [Penicillium taxi]|uniref:Winged helix-turn-helix transcription repressor DNA-binding n=1 Tax=Penicillium taxi TaxID=168475 RepID=UPI002544E521|nr:Winged helix-turn-helix transcription repressor DNA-binding [Penicillium taxi]KAJ5907325.1 Winged helix-turn-helix transcription repressor DNA-binding [Penicillium taxi]
MGSKTPENDGETGRNDAPNTNSAKGAGGEPRGSHLSRDGDCNLGDDDGDDDPDGDNLTSPLNLSLASEPKPTTSSKKKKRRKPKKASSSKQSSPPRVPLVKLFPDARYPAGECLIYESEVDNTARTTAEETRYESRMQPRDGKFLENYRKAAEVHREVRKWVQNSVQPGQTLTDIAVSIEDGVRALLDNAGLEPGDGLLSGIGFPTGLSLNNCVAHYTPNPKQKEIFLQASDVMKVDFGVHINGWIVDSAFTMSFDPTYDNLLAAVKDATNTGIKNAGVDVRICDISAAIQEAMESYEVEINGKTIPVKAVRGITGHNINQYQIHGGKSIPFVKNNDQTKMELGEIFAIETFGTTGSGSLVEGPGVYGYGREFLAPKTVHSHLASAKSLYKTINANFGSLVFCRRYLERLGIQSYLAGMNDLVSQEVVEVYRPLMDTHGSVSAQFEHTILLGETSKEVISRGDDY